MKRITAHDYGFTLVELLIVITIIVIVTSALIPSFASFIRNQNVRQAQEQLKSDLRTVQNKALTGALSDTFIGVNPVAFWGIRFRPGTGTGSNVYDLFISDVDNVCPDPIPAAQNQGTSSIATTMEVKLSSFRCVFFSIRDGSITTVPAAAGIQQLYVGYIGSTAAGDCRRVFFNARGLIYVNNSGACP